MKYFSHFTGFKSYDRFRMVLEFFLPDFNRTYVVNWDSKGAKQVRIDTNYLLTLKLVNHLRSRARKKILSLMTGIITVT